MPRHTRAPAKAKHSRAHQRFHRDRIIARRWAQAKRLLGNNRVSGEHPEALRAAALKAKPDPFPTSVFERPVGELYNELAWVGCRRPRCGLCGGAQDAGRERLAAERAWREDWGV